MMGGMLCSLAVMVIFWSFVGAAFLRAACALYNKLAGWGQEAPPTTSTEMADEKSGLRNWEKRQQQWRQPTGNAVKEPGYGQAMGIIAATLVVQIVAGFVIGAIMGGMRGPDAMMKRGNQWTIHLIGWPFGILVLAVMLTILLPTTFGKAVIVSLLYLVISVLVVAGILAILFVLFTSLGIAGRGWGFR